MRPPVLLGLVVGILAQGQTQSTQSLGIATAATPTATLPITPPSQRPIASCSADPLWHRLRNAEGLDPCALAMNLQQTCTTIDPIVALTSGESYTGPENVGAATPCICTTVMYNLVAGCAACQHQLSSKVTQNWVSWSKWSALCQNRDQILDGVWNRATLFNSTIPQWAFAKVFQTNWFDLQQAINIGVSSSAVPSSTSSSTSAPPASNDNATITAIVAVVLGGIGLFLLLLTILFCYLRRRQRIWEELEGVNRLDTHIIGRSLPFRAALQKDLMARYGVGGPRSPSQDECEKRRLVMIRATVPDVLTSEHRRGKPEYAMPIPVPAYGNSGGGFGQYQTPRSQYTPVLNPGVAGIGAGGRGLAPVNLVAPRDGPSGAATQVVVADVGTTSKTRKGVFQEDFSAGDGYRSSADADGQPQHIRNGDDRNSRDAFPPSSHAYPFTHNCDGNDNTRPISTSSSRFADQPDEEVHAVSTVGDTSISLYPPSADQHGEHPPLYVGGFAASEKSKEEYQLPSRGYSGGYSGGGIRGSSVPSSPLDTDPFGASRWPSTFGCVFSERPSGNMVVCVGRASVDSSPTSPAATQGRGSPVVARVGASLVLNRSPSIGPVRVRRGGMGNSPQDMGFGRRHQATISALSGPAHRDSKQLGE